MSPYRQPTPPPSPPAAKFKELFVWQLGEYAWSKTSDKTPMTCAMGGISWPCRPVFWRLWWVGSWVSENDKWLNQPILPTDPGA